MIEMDVRTIPVRTYLVMKSHSDGGGGEMELLAKYLFQYGIVPFGTVVILKRLN